MKVYKVLNEDGSAFHGGRGRWPLPTENEPGDWLHSDGKIEPCVRGLHLCRRRDLVHWLGPAIFEAEYRGEMIVADDDKIVVSSARLLRRLDTWNEQTARLFAADCASRAVRQCRKQGIEIDPRVTDCIRVVYRFTRGDARRDERSAAESFAWAAAEWAARSAAEWAAKSAAWSAARSVAKSAARAAARAAAESVAKSSAKSAARAWQTKRLFEYLDGRRGACERCAEAEGYPAAEEDR